MESVKILIVDDEQEILENFSYVLRKFQDRVCFTTSGNKAISILKSEKIDVIFSDFNMPDGNGTELYRYVKENHPKIDMYFFSGNQIDHLIDESFIKGIFGKPKDMMMMLDLIRGLLES